MNADLNPYQSPSETSPAKPTGRRLQRGARFQPGHTRATIAIVLLALSMIANLLEVGSMLLQVSLLNDAAKGTISAEAANQNDARVQAAIVLDLVVFIGSGIAFVVWLYRAVANLRALGIERPSYSPGWAIGAWFIPFGNLYIPYKIMTEVWNGSAPENAANRYATRAKGISLVGWWWAAWIVSNVIERVGGMVLNAKDIDTLLTGSWISIVACLLSLVAAALAIHLIRCVDANQSARYEAVQEIEPQKPTTNPSFDFLDLPGTPA